jgi:hypothetical protein
MTLQKWMYASIIGAALAASVFFGVLTGLVLRCRTLPDQAADTLRAWTPKTGEVDADLTGIYRVLPEPGKLNRLADAATQTVSAFSQVAPAATAAINATAANINRPCAGHSGPGSCGTLAQANKTMIDAGDAIVTTQIAERTAARQMVATMGDVDADAKDLDADLKDPAMHDAAANLATAEATSNGILLDVKKETDQMVAPKTRKQKVMSWMPAGIKMGAVAACLATGTPCP